MLSTKTLILCLTFLVELTYAATSSIDMDPGDFCSDLMKTSDYDTVSAFTDCSLVACGFETTTESTTTTRAMTTTEMKTTTIKITTWITDMPEVEVTTQASINEDDPISTDIPTGAMTTVVTNTKPNANNTHAPTGAMTTVASTTPNNPNNTDVPVGAMTTAASNTNNNAFAYCPRTVKTSADYTVSIRTVGSCGVCLPTTTSSAESTTTMQVFKSTTMFFYDSTTDFTDGTIDVTQMESSYCQPATTSATVTISYIGNCACPLSTTSTMSSTTTSSLNTTESSTSLTTTPLSLSSTVTSSDAKTTTKEIPTTPEVPTTTIKVITTTLPTTTTPKPTLLTTLSTSTKATTLSTTTKAATTTTTAAKPTTTTSSLCVPKRNATGVTLSSVGNCGLASCPNPTTTTKSTTTTTTTKAAMTTKTAAQTTDKMAATTAKASITTVKVTGPTVKVTGTTGKATTPTGNATTPLSKVTAPTGATSDVTEANINLGDYCLDGNVDISTVSITSIAECKNSSCGVSTTSAPTTTSFRSSSFTKSSKTAATKGITSDNNVTLHSQESTTPDPFYDAINVTANPNNNDSADNSTDASIISTKSFNASDVDDGNTTSPTKDTSADSNVGFDSSYYCGAYKASANYSVSIHQLGTCDYSKCAKTTTTSYKTTTANYLTDQTKPPAGNDTESTDIVPTGVTLADNNQFSDDVTSNQTSDGVSSLPNTNQSPDGITAQPNDPDANNGCVVIITVDLENCNCSNYDFANITDICNVTILASNETQCLNPTESTTTTSTTITIVCDPTTSSTTQSLIDYSTTKGLSNTQSDSTASTTTQNDTTLNTNIESDSTAKTNVEGSSTLALSTMETTDTFDPTMSLLMSTVSEDGTTDGDTTIETFNPVSRLDLTSTTSPPVTTNTNFVSKTTNRATDKTKKTSTPSSSPTTSYPSKTTVTKVSDRTTTPNSSPVTSTSKSSTRSHDPTTKYVTTTSHTNTTTSKQKTTTSGNVASKETTISSTNSGKTDKTMQTTTTFPKTSKVTTMLTQSTANSGDTKQATRQSTAGTGSQVTSTPSSISMTTTENLNTVATILTSPQSTTLNTVGTTKGSSKTPSSVSPSSGDANDGGSNDNNDTNDDDDKDETLPTEGSKNNDNTSPTEKTKAKNDASTSPMESTKASTEPTTTIPTTQPTTTKNPCSVGCLNDGVCGDDGTCICVDGYFGKDCGQNLPSRALAITSTVITVAIAASQSAPAKTKYLWPRYSTAVRMPTNPHEFFRLLAAYFLTIALGVNSMLGMPASNDIEHLPKCAMSYLFGTGAFFLSLTAMIFEAGVDVLTLSGAKFNAWTRPAERRLRSFPFWPTVTLYVLVGVAPTAGLWLKHWTFCVTTRSCIGSLGYGDFDREVKEASWLQLTVTLFYMAMAAVIGILAIACNSFDICKCRRRTEAWSINPLIYGREVWPLEANAYFWLVAFQPVMFGICWMSYQLVNDQRTIAAQWINLILTSIYGATSSVQGSLTTSAELSGTVCSGMTMVPEGMLSFMPSMDHVSLKDKKSILKAQMHPEDWEKFEAKELNNGPVAAYPVRYDNIPFGLAQYMCRLWSVNYIRMRESGLTVDESLLKMAQLFLLQIPDLRSINTFDFAHLFCSWTDEVRVKDSDSVSHDILHRSLRIMDRHMDLSVPPPVIIVKECGTETVYRRKVTHLTPMDGEEKVINARKTSKDCDISLDDKQPAFVGPKCEENAVSALVPHELVVAYDMDHKNHKVNSKQA